MVVSSGFSPIVKKPQMLQFQGRHQANNEELGDVKSGDPVTLLHSKLVTHAIYDLKDETMKIVDDLVLDSCDTYEVVTREGHQGRTVDGHEVPENCKAAHDGVDYLVLKDKQGREKTLLYGPYTFKNEKGEQVQVKPNIKGKDGKPVMIINDKNDQQADSYFEIQKGVEPFNKFNPFAQHPKGKPLPEGLEHIYT